MYFCLITVGLSKYVVITHKEISLRAFKEHNDVTGTSFYTFILWAQKTPSHEILRLLRYTEQIVSSQVLWLFNQRFVIPAYWKFGFDKIFFTQAIEGCLFCIEKKYAKVIFHFFFLIEKKNKHDLTQNKNQGLVDECVIMQR